MIQIKSTIIIVDQVLYHNRKFGFAAKLAFYNADYTTKCIGFVSLETKGEKIVILAHSFLLYNVPYQ